MKTLDEYIEERNEIQLIAEASGESFARRIWTELGVANRHIERVLDGVLGLQQCHTEIEACFIRVRKLLEEPNHEPR